jgi:hypothetical protein
MRMTVPTDALSAAAALFQAGRSDIRTERS